MIYECINVKNNDNNKYTYYIIYFFIIHAKKFVENTYISFLNYLMCTCICGCDEKVTNSLYKLFCTKEYGKIILVK